MTVSVVDTGSATSGSGISRTSLNFGADVPNRIIVVAFSFLAGGVRSVSSVTVAGVAATFLDSSPAGTSNISSYMYRATISGTSGDVVVTLSGTLTEISIATYRV